VVTMVFMRQTIPRIPHIMPIYWPIHTLTFPCQALLFGRLPPVLNFAEIHARGPRGLLRIAPRDLIPPPPVHASARRLCACGYRQRHPAQCTRIAMRTFSSQQRRCTQLGSSQETAAPQPRRALDHMQPVRCSSQQRPAVSPTFGVSARYVAVAGQRSN